MKPLKEAFITKKNIKYIDSEIYNGVDFTKDIFGVDAPLRNIQKFIEKNIKNIRIELKDGFLLYLMNESELDILEEFLTTNKDDDLTTTYDFSKIKVKSKKEFMNWIKDQKEENILFFRFWEM